MPELSVINDLLLDEENPRFGSISGQKNIIEFFAKDRKVKKLAKDIVENGLSPIDRILVLKKGRKYVVLEGNRRVAALKLLNSPEAAGDKVASSYYRRIVRGESVLDRVDCILTPSRLDARLWIMRKHNGEMGGIGTVDWDTLEQERFLRQNGDEGRNSHLLTLVDAILLKEETDLPVGCLSVIDRILHDDTFSELLAVKLLSGGEIEYGVSEEDLVRFFERVISDYQSKKIDTRKLNDTDQLSTYIKEAVKSEFSISVPAAQQQSHRTTGKGDKGKSDSNSDNSKTSGKRSGRGINVTLIDRSWINPSTHDKIVSIVDELQRLSYRGYLVSAAGALRSLLEVSCLHYREKVCGTKPERRHKLNDVLRTVATHANGAGIVTDAQVQRVVTIATDANSPVGVDALNGALHNPNYTVDHHALKSLWNDIRPFLEAILTKAENAKP